MILCNSFKLSHEHAGMTDFMLFKEYDQYNRSVIAAARSYIITGSWESQCSCVHPNAGDVSCWNSSLTSQGNRLTHCAGSPRLLGPVPVSQGIRPAWTLLWTRKQGCRGNLEGSGARGESPKSTGKVFISSDACGKKLVNNSHFLNLKTHMVYDRTWVLQSQANLVFHLLKAREPVTHSRQ